MLQNNAQIDIQNHAGDTPLHVAANSGRIEIFTQLLQQGADINAKNKTGNSPLHVATNEGHGEIVTEG